MKSKVFHFEKPFEHSPKASKLIDYTDLLFQANVENPFGHMILYVRKYAGFDGAVHFP